MQNLADGMFIVIGMLLFAFIATMFGMWAEPYIMKSEFMKKLIGIEECKLSEVQRMGLIGKLDYQIKEFVEDWREGQSNVLAIPLFRLGLNGESYGIEKEIETLRNRLVYLQCVESVEMCEDRFNLLVSIDMNILNAFYEARLQEWRTQGELERAEYYASRGVI